MPTLVTDAKNTAMFNKPFDLTVIYNRVPYIRRLEFEEGFSLRGSHGFTRKAVAHAEIFST